ncbi:RNA polymerase sigma factor [Paenibacillus sp. PL2-23]|uniref:RNA polymerase sigma factor n=1 Tax=Paenibacillus sp. PL2-23 TaxID=2100729 RepID=UPI0030F80B2F
MELHSTEKNACDWQDRQCLEVWQDILYRYCLSLTGSEWDADDLAQTVWLKALRILRECGHQNVEAFLLRIAKNSWIDHCRRQSALLDRLSRFLPDEVQLEGGSLELERIFQSLLNHCPPLQRTVFVLREGLGYSIAETAELMNTTEGAIKAALYRARQSLCAIRAELESEDVYMPHGMVEQQLLRELVEAYEEGDAEALIERMYRHSFDHVSAVGTYSSSVRSIDSPSTGQQPHMSLSMSA